MCDFGPEQAICPNCKKPVPFYRLAVAPHNIGSVLGTGHFAAHGCAGDHAKAAAAGAVAVPPMSDQQEVGECQKATR